MKNVLILLLLSTFARAQQIDYAKLNMGKYAVSYTNYILFDKQYDYNEFGYSGKKPVFLQVWSPIKKYKNMQTLTIEELMDYGKNERLKGVIDKTNLLAKEIFIRDFIEENYVTGNSNDFGGINYDSVYSLILNLKTKSSTGLIPVKSKFPVIVYHHGSQSNGVENLLMAEYFASHGYIFVSANFHLPYANTTYGLKPYNLLVKGEEEANLKFVTRFAKSLSTNPKLIFIGHSYGAQMGLRTFAGDTLISKFISLETTLEYQTDTNKIKDFWPEVYQKVQKENAHYPYPILFCAASNSNKPFPFFEQLNAKSKSYLHSPNEFEHNAYLSFFYLRLFLPNGIVQTDRSIMEERFGEYRRVLEKLKAFY